MCSFRIIDGDCSASTRRKISRVNKIIDKQIEQRSLEKFYEEVKKNKNLIERDYYIEFLKKKGFIF